MTDIRSEIQSLSPSATIELFELDMTLIPGGSIERFHAGTNGIQQPIVWTGQTYMPAPIEAEGFDVSAQGTLPRPKIRVANAMGVLSEVAAQNDDLVGCKVTRIRTLARYLDAVNFPGGNANADPSQELPRDIYFVEQKTNETIYVVEWELSSAFDLFGVQLPRRQVIQNTCMSKYRSAECSYVGSAKFTVNDQPTTDPAKDVCGKRLSSCKARFGESAVLPYGGFPGAVRSA